MNSLSSLKRSVEYNLKASDSLSRKQIEEYSDSSKWEVLFELPNSLMMLDVRQSPQDDSDYGVDVRRQASHKLLKHKSFNKNLYTMLLTPDLDLNTMESLRLASWYLQDDTRQHVPVIPISTKQFISIIQLRHANGTDLSPAFWEGFFLRCLKYSNLDAPAWKARIEQIISSACTEILSA
jgi:hypothetical protein